MTEMIPTSRPEQTIALVLYPGLTALDMVGPLQVLNTLARLEPRFRVTVVAERIEPMESDIHFQLVADSTFTEVPHPDVIVVPGGRAATIRAMSDPGIRTYVRTASESARFVTSVCTGSLILAALGMLDGRPATTNWFFHKVLEQFGATYQRERWVEDGKIITGAGVSAGIDMALYLVSRLTDEATARRVQREMDYDPQPPFGGIDWDHVPVAARAFRGAIGLAAPLLAAKAQRLSA